MIPFQRTQSFSLFTAYSGTGFGLGMGAGFALGYGHGLLRKPFMYQPIGYEHPFEGNRRNANGFGRYTYSYYQKRIKFVLYFASDAQKPEIPPGR